MSAPEHFPTEYDAAPEDHAPDWSAANGIYCQYCGATPAAEVDLRGHRGFLIFMQFLKQPGPFCRDCGLATYRRMTGESLLVGWWGFASFFINPITMLINLPARAKVAKLPAPLPGSPYQPMAPGKPMYERWQFLGILIPLLAVASLVFAAGTSASSTETSSSGYVPFGGTPDTPFVVPTMPVIPSIPAFPSMPRVLENTGTRSIDSAKVGDCLWNRNGSVYVDDSNPDMELVPCDDPRAQAEVLAKYGIAGAMVCEMMEGSDASYTVNRGGDTFFGGSYTLCLRTFR